MNTVDNRNSELSQWIAQHNYDKPRSKFLNTNSDDLSFPTHNVLVGGTVYIPQQKYYHFLSKYSNCALCDSNSFYFSENANPSAFRYFIDIDYKVKVPIDVSKKSKEDIAEWSYQTLSQCQNLHQEH